MATQIGRRINTLEDNRTFWELSRHILHISKRDFALIGRRLLNPGIRITDDGMRHVLERHSVDGIPKYASKFNRDEDIRALIEAGSQQPMVNQANGRRARTFRAGHEIGLDRATGKQTDLMTVITKSDGTLVTAFPGEPVTPSSSTKRSD